MPHLASDARDARLSRAAGASSASLQRRQRLSPPDASSRRWSCPADARRRDHLADSRVASGVSGLRLRLLHRRQTWNPVTEKFGAGAAIYGTLVTSAIAMADRRAGRPRHRDVPHRTVSAHCCAARSASRSSCWPASPASSTASGASVHLRAVHAGTMSSRSLISTFGERSGLSSICSPGRRSAIGMLTAGTDPRDHGPAVRHRDLARRVRNRAADAEGSRLRHRLHDLGSRQQHRHSLHPRRRHRRRHAGARAARSAKRWRSHSSSATRTRFRPRSSRRARRSPPRSPTNSPKRSATSTPPRLIALGFILFIITFIVLADRPLMLVRLEVKAGR